MTANSKSDQRERALSAALERTEASHRESYKRWSQAIEERDAEIARFREALSRLVAAVQDSPAATRRESWMSPAELTHLDPEDWLVITDAAHHGAGVLDGQVASDETQAERNPDA